MNARLALKICGVTRADEVEVLGTAGVDYAGVWHGVGGKAELPLPRCRELARSARAAGLEAVLVTFVDDPKRLRDIVLEAGVRWLQLHGYQTPATVAAVKRSAPEDTRIIKVLHLRGGECAERSLVPAYERAGVDVFLLDSVGPGGQLGSTGEPLDPAAVATLVPRLSRPFMLAGGVTADVAPAFLATASGSACAGIDVDGGARGADGAIDAARVKAIRNVFDAERLHH